MFWGGKGVQIIKNLDHNLDCIAANCTYRVPSRSGATNDGDSNRTDGNVDGNCPYTDHFAVDTHTTSVSNAVLLTFDRNNNQHSPDTFVAYANCRTFRLGHCSNLQTAENDRPNAKKISVLN